MASELPKVELHLHLDGSLSPEFIVKQAGLFGIGLPVENPVDNIRAWLHQQKTSTLKQTDGTNKVSVGQNWPVFDFCNQFLQTGDQLNEATNDLLNRLAAQNVVYAEIRFCPALHTQKGLTCDQALGAVVKGYSDNDKLLCGGIIVCALRSKSKQHSVEMAELAAKYMPFGVVGYDVAGDEGSYPLNSEDDNMTPGVKKAQELGVPVTIHAGEWPEVHNTLANVGYAFNHLKVTRIGHAIALRSDVQLVKDMASSGQTTVEVCLTSNVGYKVKSYEEHPAKLFYENGLPFSLSMDNWLLSGRADLVPNSSGELLHLAQHVIGGNTEGWKAVRHSLRCGIRAAFSPSIDAQWIAKFDQQVDETFKKYQLVF